jgi:hypothetical protein
MKIYNDDFLSIKPRYLIFFYVEEANSGPQVSHLYSYEYNILDDIHKYLDENI